MFYLVLTVHVLVSAFLILVVLLQSGRSGDLATAFGGGGGSQSVFGPRATGSVLTKATWICAGLFLVTSLTLVLLGQNRSSSGRIQESSEVSAPATAPAAQSAPTTPATDPSTPPAPAPGN